MELSIEEYYKKSAQEIINYLLESGLLNKTNSALVMNELEEYIGYCIQWRCEMAVKADRLSAKIRDIDSGS